MVNVLLVSPSFPFPEHRDGIAKINYNILTRCSGYRADLLTVDDSDCKRVEGVEVKLIPFVEPPKKLELLIKWITTPLPINIIKYERYMDALAKKLEKVHEAYDIIHISSPFFASVYSMVSGNIQKKLILFPIDSISLNKERMLERERSLVKKVVTYIEMMKYRRFEAVNYAKYRKTVFVSDVDSKYIKKLNPDIEAEWIPNGVDTAYFKSVTPSAKEEYSLVFTGDMSYQPNEDAVRFFIEEVLPLIRKRVKVKFYVVGKRPKEWLQRYDSDDIVVTGFVDDIRGYLERAAAYVSPLRFGSGIKNKVLEAMSMSKVVIGTEISFEAIDVQDGKSCIVVPQDASKMAEKIVEVISDIKRYEYMERNARKLVEERYSWEGIAKRYAKIYESCTYGPQS
ncbi:glycosyltransferase [Hydrogenimonas sp.]|nr:glycosyltransferase [Hydrogenimonas sp.]